jgi:hypothetical protein
MCMIIDASVAHFLSPLSAAARPVVTWIEDGNGRLVIGGRNTEELNQNEAVARWIRELLRAGRARAVSPDSLNNEEQIVQQLGACCSNDLHVIALARVSGARIIFTDDRDLHRDVTNPAVLNSPRGKVYQNASHRHLLRSSACRP